MIWRKHRSSKNDPALSIVGADLCVCPGFGMRRGAGADTQVCPNRNNRNIFVSLLSRAMILLFLIGSQTFLLATVFLLAASAVAQDPPPNAKWRLTKINFEGLKSRSPDKMIAASG